MEKPEAEVAMASAHHLTKTAAKEEIIIAEAAATSAHDLTEEAEAQAAKAEEDTILMFKDEDSKLL